MAGDTSARSDAGYLGRALRRSHLARTVDQVTEPWCNSILRAAFMGTRQFEAFQQSLGIPRQTLSLRLAYLVGIGLLRRQSYQERPPRHEYRLTPRGKALYASVLASWAWSRRWGDARYNNLPKYLVHRSCGHRFTPLLVCEHCAGALALDGVSATSVRSAREAGVRTDRGRRWRSPGPGEGYAQRDILAVIDDRWSVLIVAAAMLGVGRYDDFVGTLAISSGVLAARLQRLCALEVLCKRPDPADGRRSQYHLGPAGRDFFPYLLAFSSWGGAATGRADTVGWVHRHCGERVLGRMVCRQCGQVLLPTEVEPAQARTRRGA
jgi:DNA-binding HxlR family transcriptional regulator